ncbi:MAG: hypothetical protein R3B90_05360 [Planctomycetaceae bacterium]
MSGSTIRGKEVRVVYLGLCVKPEMLVDRPKFAPDGPFLFSIGECRPSKTSIR